MQNPFKGGRYSVITAGTQDKDGKYTPQYSFSDLDSLQAEVLGVLCEAINKKEFGKFTIKMAESEINECIIDTVFSKLPRGSVCLTRFDLEFEFIEYEDTYKFTFLGLKTDFNTKSFIVRNPETEENKQWHQRIKYMAYQWLTKILEVRAFKVGRNKEVEKELKETGLTCIEFPQENVKVIVGIVKYSITTLTHKRGAVIVYDKDKLDVEWSE